LAVAAVTTSVYLACKQMLFVWCCNKSFDDNFYVCRVQFCSICTTLHKSV